MLMSTVSNAGGDVNGNIITKLKIYEVFLKSISYIHVLHSHVHTLYACFYFCFLYNIERDPPPFFYFVFYVYSAFHLYKGVQSNLALATAQGKNK